MPDLTTITRLGTLLAKHALAFKAGGGATGVDDPAITAADGEDFATTLESFGPAYIKFGQLLSTREDLLPAAYTTALSRLQDSVQAVPVEEIRQVIETELRAPVKTLFSSFDDKPLATASLAQVHRATTRSGRDVVVKVLRPGVREVVRADLESLTQLADFVDQRTPLGPRLGASRMLGQFRRSMADELDYRKEAANLALFSKLAEDEPLLVIPGVVADYSTESVLTLDHISGKKVTDVTPLGLLDIDGPQLCRHGTPAGALRRRHAPLP